MNKRLVTDHSWTWWPIYAISRFLAISSLIYHDAIAICLALDIGRSSKHLQKARYKLQTWTLDFNSSSAFTLPSLGSPTSWVAISTAHTFKLFYKCLFKLFDWQILHQVDLRWKMNGLCWCKPSLVFLLRFIHASPNSSLDLRGCRFDAFDVSGCAARDELLKCSVPALHGHLKFPIHHRPLSLPNFCIRNSSLILRLIRIFFLFILVIKLYEIKWMSELYKF